ncbi:hypothetical protein [Psychrobacter frigidicola]|uniref:hypothetical protein n=1 Tax=Psychrobacter frigidicola TaxID=45611 RepID=UPI0019182D3D|nr:hypothetical protein [Psychrobacter frigidicola]
MSQIFNLHLATETLLLDAQQLGVTPLQLQNINVSVSASIVPQPIPQLWLTYHVQLSSTHLATQLSWPAWEPAQVKFTDYLWEQTCLECFIASSSTDSNAAQSLYKKQNPDIATDYIEINASPNGNYALYQFESYRSPSTLPPTPLRQTDEQTLAHINWPEFSPMDKNRLESTLHSIASSINAPNYHYERSFGIPLDQLPLCLLNNSDSKDKFSSIDYIKRLHPCVILKLNDVSLYFAPAHASPPDFHQRRYWSRFDHQRALN